MAAVYQFPIFTSIRSHNFLFLSPLPPPTLQFPNSCTRIFAAATKKPRASRKLKSDADLCNDIRNFLSSVGLPENHVPSIKELSENGRQDLSNIVRRRGYKFIRQLLDASTGANSVIPSDVTDQTGKLEGENVDVVAEDVSSCEGLQAMDNNYGTKRGKELALDNQNPFTSESSTLSLQEKVAKFIEHGELDTIEDSGFKLGYADAAGWSGNTEGARGPEYASSHPEGKDLSLSHATGTETLNGNAPVSILKYDDSTSRNTCLSAEQQTFEDKNLGLEEMENRDEIEHLKFLLHQKEMELESLKEQIEKEKLSLSTLQTEAETAIGNAERLVSEKENELHCAEETLSGLKEVNIEYSGDGDVVEVAGSFNGWHHNIKMELDPSFDIISSTKSSTHRLWRAVLWLYPGVYEIKFIVDGEWKIDPERESVARHSLHNNILRVDRYGTIS